MTTDDIVVVYYVCGYAAVMLVIIAYCIVGIFTDGPDKIKTGHHKFCCGPLTLCSFLVACRVVVGFLVHCL